MNDFAAALAPKSDQINALDLIAGDMTITITGVKIMPGTEQPVSISFQGSAKVWRTCKTTGRILMEAWGDDTSVYPGRSVQLYLDPKVKWGGLEVGGIRIRALSHIENDMRTITAESKQVRRPVTIKKLVAAKAPDPVAPPTDYPALAKVAARRGKEAFVQWWNSPDGKAGRAAGLTVTDELKKIIADADAAIADDPFGLPPITDPTPDQLAAAEAEAKRAADQAAVE
jgi:hypothetical protein